MKKQQPVGDSLSLCTRVSRSEDVHGSNHVLPADGTLIHAIPTLAACDHVAALQQNAVNGRVHADLAHVLLLAAGLSGISWKSGERFDYQTKFKNCRTFYLYTAFWD